MSKLRSRITFANVVALLALFVALGGTGVADPAADAAANLGKSMKKALGLGKKANKKANKALRTAKRALAEPGPRGPTGAAGPAGPRGKAGANGSPDTPSQVLGKVRQVDGPGSELDADSIDGADGSSLLRTDFADQPSWTAIGGSGAPGFQCGWENYTQAGISLQHTKAAFYRDRFGTVHLKGLVKNGTCPHIFTLPEGYRPMERQIFAAASNNTFARVDVNGYYYSALNNWDPGRVHAEPGTYNNAWVSLDGISFRCYYAC